MGQDVALDVDDAPLPKVAGTCDICGSHDFKRRPDDNEATVRTRDELRQSLAHLKE